MARVAVEAYNTKANRRKPAGASADKSRLKAVRPLREDIQVELISTEGRALVFSTAQLQPKTTRSTQGVQVLTLKKKHVLDRALPLEGSGIVNAARYRTRTIPAAGMLLKEEDTGNVQMQMEL